MSGTMRPETGYVTVNGTRLYYRLSFVWKRFLICSFDFAQSVIISRSAATSLSISSSVL